MEIRTLIIPSENRAREFDAKLLLGCIAVEAGFRVIIGSRHDIHNWINHLPRSIYLSKDVRVSTEPIAKVLRYLGHVFVAMDEEALVYHSREQYLSARVSPILLSEAKLLFAWGLDNATAWRSHSNYEGVPILQVGNPRLDLLRPELRPFFHGSVEKLRETHGKYVLINSNFGSVNHILPDAMQTSMKRIRSAQARRFQHDIHQYRAQLFSYFANSIEPIAKALPDLSIIIRPHPSESSLPWLAVTKGLPNVHVSKEGSVVPWIMGSIALIHNGCTTALEARLLGQQVISYRPIVSTKFDIDLPNRFGVPADDVRALIRSLKDNAGPEYSGALREDEIKNLSYYIAPQTDQLCCERIVNALIALARTIEIPRPRRLQKLYGDLSASYRRNRKLHGVSIEGHKNSATYNRSRFPSISTSEVAAGVVALGNCLNRFDRVMVKHLKENIFELHQSC